MTEPEREAAIAAHLAAHDKRMAKRTRDRLARYDRNSRRGLDAAVERMMDQQKGDSRESKPDGTV